MKSAILINDTSMEGHIGSTQVIENIRRLSKENDVKIISTFSRDDVQKWCPRLTKTLKICDIIIINGEGSFHHNTPFFDILVSKRKLYEGKKIAFINSLWQEMHNLNADKFFKMCDIISFRESLSANDFINNYGKMDNVFIVPDVIFATEIPELNIGFGDSVVPNTDEFLKEFYNYFPMHNSKSPDFCAYVAWLKSLDLHITGRFHGACLCILVGTPFFAIRSNSHKIQGLLRDLKCEHLLTNCSKPVDIKNLDLIVLRGRMKEYRLEAKELLDELFMRIGRL